MIPPETIAQVAAANDLVEIVAGGVALRKSGATYTGLCPFHLEKTPSFVVTPARRSFKCFGCGVHGSVFDYVMLRDGIAFPPALRLLADRAGIPVDSPATPAANRKKQRPRPKLVVKRPEARPFRLPADLHHGNAREMRATAELRGLSLEGVTLAGRRSLLRFGTVRGCPSWITTDPESVNAQARRMDGGLWEHIGSKKAYTLPGSRAAWPIGAREADRFPFMALVEGGPGLLAAHHFIVAEGREEDVAVVAMLGAANTIPETALLVLANKRVRIYPHLDATGQQAAHTWASQLERVGCEVDAFSFEGLSRSDGSAVKDLNDLAMVDADDFEQEAADLLEVLPR